MSDIVLKAEYRGYELVWIDSFRYFRINQQNIEVKTGFRSLAECETWIDNRLKEKYKRVNVIYMGYGGELRKGVATSLIPERGDTYYVWFSNTKKQRSKENIASIYLDNETNAQILNQMIENSKQIEALKSETNTLKSTLEHLTPEMMIVNTEGKK